MNLKSLPVIALTCCALSTQAQTTQHVFSSKGVKIHYAMAGKGIPVVLIHGWMSDATMWGKDAAGNPKIDTSGAEGFQVISIDCRGHGRSDKPHDSNKYGAEMAADVVRLLDHLKIKKAHLVGYSMGAFIVGKVAATHPNRLLGAIYGGQAPILLGPKKLTVAREIEVFAKAAETGQGFGDYLIEFSPAGRPKPTKEQADAFAKFLYAGKDVKAFAAAGLSFNGLAVRPKDLAKSKVPTLFLYGSKESDSTKASVAASQKILVQSKVKVIEGADHMTTLINPEFGKAIDDFLRANSKL